MLFNFGKKKILDALIFQVTEEFIEVAAVRRDMSSGDDDVCAIEQVYTERKPRVKPAKKSLDDLAINIGKLADSAVVAKELKERNFDIAAASVVCILVEPLSIEALVTYSAKLKTQTKITKKLLKNAHQKGNITHDGLEDVPQNYASYGDTLVSVQLNGYHTERPLGRYAKTIDITFAKRLTRPELWSAAPTVLERTFNRELTYIHKAEAQELDSAELCDEIYTVSSLQEVANAII